MSFGWQARFDKFVNIIIPVVIIAVAFGILWWSGQLVRLSNYIAETREELKKCTWPTWNELKGSTVVVFISLLILGGFTVTVDLLFNFVVRLLT
jgi:preprotein translocase subunit SecE